MPLDPFGSCGIRVFCPLLFVSWRGPGAHGIRPEARKAEAVYGATLPLRFPPGNSAPKRVSPRSLATRASARMRWAPRPRPVFAGFEKHSCRAEDWVARHALRHAPDTADIARRSDCTVIPRGQDLNQNSLSQGRSARVSSRNALNTSALKRFSSLSALPTKSPIAVAPRRPRKRRIALSCTIVVV